MVHFCASLHTRHVGIEGTFLTKHLELVESYKALNFPTFIVIPWRGITFLSHPPFRLSLREPSEHSPKDFTVQLHMCLKLFSIFQGICGRNTLRHF
jgi:hypothetical protein